jgi:hypothetical protein
MDEKKIFNISFPGKESQAKKKLKKYLKIRKRDRKKKRK